MRSPLARVLCLVFCTACGIAAGGTAAGAAAPAVDSFQATAEATGTVVLWFLGQAVTADVRADITISGVLAVGGVSTPFSMKVGAIGSGTGNMNTLAVDAWVAIDGQGKTEAGAAFGIRGGISVDALDPATTSTGGQGGGHFYFLITTPDGRWVVEGDAVGNATGSFVVPDDPSSMQMTGAGSFALSGEPRPWSSADHAALPEWPAKLLAELEREAALVENEPAK